MSQVLFCHGIGYRKRHRERMHANWYDALRTGMIDTNLPPLEATVIRAVYYGNCFRSLAAKGGGEEEGLEGFDDVPNYGSTDIRADVEIELLNAFAMAADPGSEGGKGAAQALLRRLERSRLLGDVPAKAVIWMIKQMHRYLTDENLHEQVQERFAGHVTDRTRVVLAHSLGSVVAYEALCAHPEWEIDTLITVGSPLGLRTISSRLRPPVGVDGAQWPHVRRWVNVAAKEDPVALVKELGPVYGEAIEDKPVSNGRFAAHSVLQYLTTAEVAREIADAVGRG
ncbi:hypothetical protein [Actinomadura sp. WMMB 499]|uniref:hypothetical protein n=1 Tax=Actinomadura sp. WMMB 499 TaxID=1219491 RepID=UPI001245563F|nr:hypothetical protein [Actinomadura sp. WMMB 499]QFG22911.1 hypothetical protein F7P10_19115 [Actinomadura sp. WMMB 499]